MFNNRLPAGLEHSIHGIILPDLQFSFQFFAAHRRKVDHNWSFPIHEHSLYEINIVLEGKQKMQVAKQAYLQEQESMILVLPGIKHASLGPTGETMEYFCLHFDTDDLGIRQLINRFNQVLYPVSSALTTCLRPAILRLIETTNLIPANEHYIRAEMLQAGFQLFTSLIALAAEQQEPTIKSNPTAHLAARMAEYIEAAVTQPIMPGSEQNERIGIKQIAEQLGYDASYCNRIFRNAYGISPRQFMTTLQLRQAKYFLMDMTLSIDQIAILLGYQDIAHFSKQFKRWMNLSPSAYRQLSH